jgi:hypothetical protein
MSDNVLKVLTDIFTKDPRVNPVEFQGFIHSIDKKTTDSIGEYLKASNPTGGNLRSEESNLSKFSIKGELATNDPSQSMPEYETWNEDIITSCTYKKMRNDPQILASMRLIKGIVSTLSYEIETTDPRMEAVVSYVLDDVHALLIKTMIDRSFEIGYSFFEKVWQDEKIDLFHYDSDGNKVTSFRGNILSLKKVKSLDPDEGFRFFKERGTDEILYVEQNQSFVNSELGATTVVIPRQKLVWFALDQVHSDVFGRSRFKIAYEPWFFTRKVYNYMLAHIRRAGSPPSYAKFPGGVTIIDGRPVDNNKIAQQILRSLDSQSSVAWSSEPYPTADGGGSRWDVGFMDIKNSSPQPFLDVLEILFRQKVLSIGVPDSLIIGDTAYAQMDAAIDLLMQLLEDLLDQLERCIKTDVVDYIVAYNFGQDKTSKLKYRIDRNGLGKIKLMKDVLINLIRFEGSQGDFKPRAVADTAALFRKFGVSTVKFDDAYTEKVSENAKNKNMVKEDVKNGGANERRVNPSDRSGADRPSKSKDITK